jgi:hypothetical protein
MHELIPLPILSIALFMLDVQVVQFEGKTLIASSTLRSSASGFNISPTGKILPGLSTITVILCSKLLPQSLFFHLYSGIDQPHLSRKSYTYERNDSHIAYCIGALPGIHFGDEPLMSEIGGLLLQLMYVGKVKGVGRRNDSNYHPQGYDHQAGV